MNKAFKTDQSQGVFVELRHDATKIEIQKVGKSTAINFWSDSVPKNKKEFGRGCTFEILGNYKYIGQVGSADLKHTGLTKSDMVGLDKNWAIMVETV